MENLRKKIYPERNRRIGLLGLAANPPHDGHLEAARLVLEKKLVDMVWLGPCYRHSFDKSLVSPEHRWEMTLLMESEGIYVTNIEFRLKGKSYTIETVKALKEEYPGCDFFGYWVPISSNPGTIKNGKTGKNWLL